MRYSNTLIQKFKFLAQEVSNYINPQNFQLDDDDAEIWNLFDSQDSGLFM